MNTDKLREIIDRIVEAEDTFGTQGRLASLETALSRLVGQPQNPDYQNEVSTSFNEFSGSMTNFRQAFAPRDFDRVLELSAEAFSDAAVVDIARSIQENPISPNVVSDLVNRLKSDRDEIFAMVESLRSSLKFFEFGYEEADIGKADVGFQIPRALFDNSLDGLIQELTEIRRIIQFFSEASVGEYQPAKVGSISTTDPLFFFEMGAPVAKYLAGSVTWAIGVWFSVGKIRNIRAQTAQLQSFTAAEIEQIFDNKIKNEIDAAVEAKVASLLEEGRAQEARKGELSGQLNWALNALLAKIERGMTIELRIAPQPIEPDDDVGEDGRDDLRADLLEIQGQLVFPSTSDDPVLELPEFENGNDD